MKQSLQLKMGQQLAMTPQLQQAIKLLQLSSLDLQTEIQEALDSNPLLEVAEDVSDTEPSTSNTTELAQPEPSSQTLDGDLAPTADWDNDMPGELPMDSDWEGIASNNNAGDQSNTDWQNDKSADETLQDHLLWQLNLTPMSAPDRLVAQAIIDAIDSNGFLTESVTQIQQGMPPELELEEEEVLAVLHRLQQFDPPGVCAIDLPDCLNIQLRQLPEDTPYLKTALHIIGRHLSLLAQQDIKSLSRRLRVDENSIHQAIHLIRSLSPNPGEAIEQAEQSYTVPDVIIRRKNGVWAVELNPDIAPKLRLNQTYASMVKRADNSEQNQYIRDNIQQARWFMKSLSSRNDTLLRVASKIVECQQAYFEYGEEAMKPLIF